VTQAATHFFEHKEEGMEGRTEVRLPISVNERDHIIGAPDARVTVVKYGDYESPGSRKMHLMIEKMVRELLDRMCLVYRHFPLVRVHPHALRAAEAAEAAASQGMFWQMNSLLYQNPGKLEDKELRRYAKKIGLDLEKFDREMESGAYAKQILRDRNLSLTSGITGVPTFFVNGVMCAMTGMELVAAVKAISEQNTRTEDLRRLEHCVAKP
jgi:formate-nitrite transporter family protein